MLIEQDLQSALRAFDNANAPDVDAARARLDAALDGRQTVARRAGATVLRPNHWRQRAVGAVAAAACIGAVFAGGKVIESDRGAPADGPSVSVAPTISTPNPSPIRTTTTPLPRATLERPKPMGLPGTRHIAEFEGTGTSKVALPHFVVPRHFIPVVSFTCRGGALLAIGDSTSKPGDETKFYPDDDSKGCNIGPSIPPKSRWVRLTFRGQATWRMSFDLEPDLRTNATVSRSEPGRLGFQIGSGQGTKKVALPKNDYVESGILELRCAGSGVTFSSTDTRLAAFYTHTCFPGFTYQFQVDGKANVTARMLTVHANATTTWQLGYR